MTSTATGTSGRLGRFLAPTLTFALIVVGCSTGGAASTSEPTASPPPAVTAPSAGSGEPTAGEPGPVGGGELVVPKPGQLDVRPIAADSFSAQVDGRHVVLTISYTSGVEPCSVLDTIVVQRGDRSFAVTLREGHGPGDQICIMIAKFFRAQVDLGDLEPGSYTITDTMRGADPIQVVVS